MSQKIINVGTDANDGSGDTLRGAFQNVNANFTDLYANAVANALSNTSNVSFNGRLNFPTGNITIGDTSKYSQSGLAKLVIGQNAFLGQPAIQAGTPSGPMFSLNTANDGFIISDFVPGYSVNGISQSNGKVGIGYSQDKTAASTDRLMVAGSVNATSFLVNGVDVISSIYNQANSAYDLANNIVANTDVGSAFDKANAANVLAFNSNANAAASFNAANVSFNRANSANVLASNSFNKANAANVLAFNSNANAAAAFDKANSISANTDVGPAFNKANAANVLAFNSNANAAAAFDKANSITANTDVGPAFDKANAANVLAFNSSANASAAFDKANSANVLASNSFDKANAANVLAFNSNANAAAAFDKANSVSIITSVGPAFDRANAANVLAANSFDKANTANVLAANSFDKANAANVLAFNSNANAAAAFDKANSIVANTDVGAAFDKANAANVLAFSRLANTSDISFNGNLKFPRGNIAIGTSDPSTYFSSGPVQLVIAQSQYGGAGFVVGTPSKPMFSLNTANDGFTLYDYVSNSWRTGIAQANGNIGIGFNRDEVANTTHALTVNGTVNTESYLVNNVHVTKSQWNGKNVIALGASTDSLYPWVADALNPLGANVIRHTRNGRTAKNVLRKNSGGGPGDPISYRSGTPLTAADFQNIDAVHIHQGTNDWSQSLPIGSRTDIVVGDTTDTTFGLGSNTYYGYMRNAIETIQSWNPNTAIILSTTLFRWTPGVDIIGSKYDVENGIGLRISDYNDALKDIATMYDNVYLNDIHDTSRISWSTYDVSLGNTGSYYYPGNDFLSGTISYSNGTNTVTGVGTTFTKDFIVYDRIVVYPNTVFSGTGLNDLTTGGSWKGSLNLQTSNNYYVRIMSTGTPDKFQWSYDNFVTLAGNNISINSQTDQQLGENITIRFGSNTGHTLNDTWSFSRIERRIYVINSDTSLVVDDTAQIWGDPASTNGNWPVSASSIPYKKQYYGSDGIHPTKEGYQWMSSATREFFNTMDQGNFPGVKDSKNLIRSQWSNQNVVTLGDSITALYDWVGDALKPLGARVFRHARNGRVSANLLSRNDGTGTGTALTSADFANTAAVNILIGTNDWGGNVPLGYSNDSVSTASFYGYMKNAVSSIQTWNSNTKVILNTILYRSGSSTNSLGLTIDDYNTAIKQVGLMYGTFVHDLNRSSLISSATANLALGSSGSRYYSNNDLIGKVTVVSGSNTVTGFETAFTKDFLVYDRIVVNGTEGRIVSIANSKSLTVDGITWPSTLANTSYKKQYYGGDGLHPTKEGYQWMSAATRQFYNSLYITPLNLAVTANGDVGVGTFTPVHYDDWTSLTIDGPDNGGLLEFRKAGTGFFKIGLANNSNATLLNSFGSNIGPVQVAIAGAPKLTVTPNGNIGIGNTDPTDLVGWTSLTIGGPSNGGLLEFRKAGTGYFKIGTDGANGTLLNSFGSNAGPIHLAIAGASRLSVTAPGDVGIGTSNPSYKLDVRGTINTAALFVNDVLVDSATALTLAGQSFNKANSANVLAFNTGIGSNTWANTVGTAGNNYTNYIGTAGNNYVDVTFNKNVPTFNLRKASGGADIGSPGSFVGANVTFDVKEIDTHNSANATTGIFTPNVAGYYMFTGSARITANAGLYIPQAYVALCKNGAANNAGSATYGDTDVNALSVVSGVFYLNGTTDYVQLKVFTPNNSVIKSNSLGTRFAGFLFRGA